MSHPKAKRKVSPQVREASRKLRMSVIKLPKVTIALDIPKGLRKDPAYANKIFIKAGPKSQETTESVDILLDGSRVWVTATYLRSGRKQRLSLRNPPVYIFFRLPNLEKGTIRRYVRDTVKKLKKEFNKLSEKGTGIINFYYGENKRTRTLLDDYIISYVNYEIMAQKTKMKSRPRKAK